MCLFDCWLCLQHLDESVILFPKMLRTNIFHIFLVNCSQSHLCPLFLMTCICCLSTWFPLSCSWCVSSAIKALNAVSSPSSHSSLCLYLSLSPSLCLLLTSPPLHSCITLSSSHLTKPALYHRCCLIWSPSLCVPLIEQLIGLNRVIFLTSLHCTLCSVRNYVFNKTWMYALCVHQC